MNPTAKRTVSKGRKVEQEAPHRRSDIVGILLLAVSLILGITLALGNTGLLGDALGSIFQTLFGKAAWAVPVCVAAMGVAALRDGKSKLLAHVGWGLALLFFALVGALATDRNGDFFDPEFALRSGGYVGAVFGWAFTALLGTAKLVGLGALGTVGLILCVDRPIASYLRALRERSRRPKPVAAVEVKEARTVKGLEPEVEEKPQRDPPTEHAKEERKKVAPVIKDVAPTFSSGDLPGPKEGYRLPPLSLLGETSQRAKRDPKEMQRNIETLESTLDEFGIEANVVEVATGPTVTRFEIQLGPGIRVARITALADNIAMNLAASHVRVEAPIPGKAAIGVEVPNSAPTAVSLREVAETQQFAASTSPLTVCLGKDVSGEPKFADLTTMPHLLIGGATNSGKSIGLASIIMSLLIRNTPKDLRLVMIDPKRVELALFDNVPHLLCPVVKDVKEAPGVLRAVWREMDRRYDVFSAAGCRNIVAWNEKASFQDRMPYIVVIIDELADLMIQAAAEVETSICRLAQLARATGIHLVIATQRPSVDVITGTIKANIASRIAFTVSSQVDSRTILDQAGAERLIGRGDMLFLPINASKPLRIQGCYVSEKEIDAVCQFWRDQERPIYQFNPAELAQVLSQGADGHDDGDAGVDALWEDAVRWVSDRKQASTSMLQRRFSIGFQRASRLLDSMEERGIVGPRDGPRPREVLLTPMEVEELFGGRRYDLGDEPEPHLEATD